MVSVQNSAALLSVQNSMVALPRVTAEFAKKEVHFGKLLGAGEFGSVHEVTAIHLTPKIFTPHHVLDSGANILNEERKYMKESVLRGDTEDVRYAVKVLHHNLKGKSNALMIEAEVLAKLNHPNILKMRAIANVEFLDPNFFIVLDKLYDTVGERIDRWKNETAEVSSILCKLKTASKDRKKEKYSQLLDRLKAAYDISSAIRYLHNRGICYRDIKPENAGFDIRDNVKIFDFGFAREVERGRELQSNNETFDVKRWNTETFHLTGYIGTRRYMSPEVVRCKPYNLKADVYSYTVMLWQMISLKVPFEGYSVDKFEKNVALEGDRPNLTKYILKVDGLGDLITKGWDPDISNRPAMSEVATLLKCMMENITGFTEEISDRSNHLSKLSKHSRHGKKRH